MYSKVFSRLLLSQGIVFEIIIYNYYYYFATITVFIMKCSLDVLVSSKDQVMTHDLKSPEPF